MMAPLRSGGMRWLRGIAPRDALLLAVFLCVLIGWGYAARGEYANAAASGWGDYRIALSDAAVWQRGGFRFFFGLPAEPNLYRPTIGVLYASLIALTGTAQPIALVPVLLFPTLALLMFWSCARGDRLLCLAIFSTFLLTFHSQFSSSYASIGTCMTELLVLDLTLGSIFFLTSALRDERILFLPAAAGLTLLGMATALRGLPLAGGALVLVGVSLRYARRVRWSRLGALWLIFLTPFLFDVLLQRHFGIRNNALQIIYVFIQPPHTWVQATHWAYLRSHTPDSRVFGMFVDFMVRGNGVSTVLNLMATYAQNQMRTVQHGPWFFCLVALVSFWHRASAQHNLRLKVAHLALLVLVLLGDVVERRIFLAWLAVMVLVAFRKRMPLTFVSLCVYLGCLALYVITCSPGNERTASTFQFALYIACLSFGWELSASNGSNRFSAAPPLHAARGTFALVAWLYLGFLIVPRSIQKVYASEVEGKSAALKLASDDARDRSLYIQGEGITFLTRKDPVPPGTVVRYRKLAAATPPSSLTNDPGMEKMQIVFETSRLTPFSFVP